MLLLMFLWLRRTVSWFRSPEIVVDNVEHIAMNKELKVLMKAREYSGMVGSCAVEDAGIAAKF